MESIETERLLLVAYKINYIEATLLGKENLSHVSGYDVSSEWPGIEFSFYLPFALEELKKRPEMEKWTRLIILKKENKIIGEISMQGNAGARWIPELGYGIVDSYSNQGFVSEAIKLFLKWSVEMENISFIKAKTFSRNKKSQHILENNGFIKTGEGIIGRDEKVIEFEWKNKYK
ncbi:Acetyltransferase (GNAT) domain-containing protein [Carnobacterium iners]|uniref:Acetyltransferase (GNAT) domain-containing protein n=1 Tax=Carnobacterium iners TaxID=1073423 RepID=A0A1X7NPF9_9LACT|nr:GNAT family protein [Carnobacterium iners]SEK31263.1 Acetyltransferase (GNAT) domain-containing protein [Carnobacterium iners]SMH39339.1 Acetyltransferase (GNAT) domain-containing protein [Carnobacterium iners]